MLYIHKSLNKICHVKHYFPFKVAPQCDLMKNSINYGWTPRKNGDKFLQPHVAFKLPTDI